MAWALASSTHSMATTVTSSKPPRKKYRPSRALHRLAHVFSERKIAPAHSKLAKNRTFAHAGAKNISRHPTAPHAGAVFLSLLPLPNPTCGTRLALLASISVHTRKSSPSTAKTAQNQRFFACWTNYFAVRTRIHSCWANFFAPMRPQLPHNTCRPPCLKPMTPMRVGHCLEMKPMTPLRAPSRTRLKPLTPLLAQNSQIQAVFRPQRCHGFHAPLAEHPQRHRRFHEPLPNRPQRCPRFHPRRTLRPQPKPCVACTHATTPVAHWPHD